MRLRLLASQRRHIGPQVLLIEGDPRLSKTLGACMEKCGLGVTVEATRAGALEQLGRYQADAVILDLDLRDMDVMDVLAAAREHGVLAPVLVMTSRTSVESRVAALDAGADDCMVKPFVIAEFLSRLRALLRRSGPHSKAMRFGDLNLESERRVVSIGDNTIVLSPREHAILQHLVRRGCHVSSRREILNEVFGYQFDPGTNVVAVHIAHLRRKLAGCDTQIETIRGGGYRLRTGTEMGAGAESEIHHH